LAPVITCKIVIPHPRGNSKGLSKSKEYPRSLMNFPLLILDRRNYAKENFKNI